MFVDSSNLSMELSKEFEAAQTITLISAFVTTPGVAFLNKHNRNNPKVLIIGRFLPSDFLFNASDLKALKLALNLNFEIRRLHNLHAKVFCIDQRVAYVGSANMTNKGLNLTNGGNVEATLKVSISCDLEAFINNTINASEILTLSDIELLEEHISSSNDLVGDELDKQWFEKLNENLDNLNMNDLPHSYYSHKVNLYKFFPELPFATIEHTDNIIEKKVLFENTAVYRWLVNNLKESNNNSLSYGALSAKLHDSLSKEQKIYRKEVKQVLSYIISYVEKLSNEKIDIKILGRRSQIFILKETSFSD